MSDEFTIKDSEEKIAWTVKLLPRAGLYLSPDAPLSSVIEVLNAMGLEVQGEDYIARLENLPGVKLEMRE